MSEQSAKGRLVVIAVGLFENMRIALERECAGLYVRCVFTRRDGQLRLEPPPGVARTIIETAADQAHGYDGVLIFLLPYAAIPPEVHESVRVLEELGATVLRPLPGTAGWPSRPRSFDNQFRDALLAALASAVRNWLPPGEVDEDELVAFEILRGLATHDKMGPNNHSHEDDLWKSRGNHLRPSQRKAIENSLLATGILARKKNDSMGGKGWVYWIADVGLACQRFPDLTAFVKSRT